MVGFYGEDKLVGGCGLHNDMSVENRRLNVKNMACLHHLENTLFAKRAVSSEERISY